MKETKINMVSCQHFLSGIGQYGYQLSQKMQEKGREVHLFKPAKKGYKDSHVDTESWVTPIRYKSLGSLHPYILPLFISKQLALQNNKAIYHAHWFLSGLAVSYIKKKFVVTMHDVSLMHVKEKNSHYTKYYAWAISRFKKLGVPIITVSKKARMDAIEYGNIPEKQVHTVYNGIDFNRFNINLIGNSVESTVKYSNANTLSKNHHEVFTIVYAGGLGPRKNLKLLLEAYKDLEEKYPFLQLKIAGAFPERTSSPSHAISLGIKNIRFTGYLPDEEMPEFYRQADLFIFPSEYEGFGFAPLEAMACGTPVLCAKGGALQEISGGGANLFDYDKDDLVEKASQLIESDIARKKLIAKGSEWVQQYQWEKTAEQTETIYQLIA
ncbi:MAG: glycosyltransferase family 1 protein [Bacteroidota bacterium]